MAGKKKTSPRRKRICDQYWPDAHKMTYDADSESGWTRIPRTLPMIAALVRRLPGFDASRVYIELWSRVMDPPGFVEIHDEEECANACGHLGPRAARTWRERIDVLEEFGFVEVKPKGTRQRAYVLMLHPHQVVKRLRDERPDQVPDWWWSVFVARLASMGAELPVEELADVKAK